MCKWPTVWPPRNALAFYFIWFWFWLCLLLLATCYYFASSLSIEQSKAKRTAHAGCWWSNAQCCCLIKSRMREFYFALPQSRRRCCCRSHCCCQQRQLSVCMCLQQTLIHISKSSTSSSSRMCCRFFRFLLPTPRFPLTNTCAQAYIAYTFAQFSLTGSFVIKLAGTTSQQTATKSTHSGYYAFHVFSLEKNIF